MSIPNVYVKTPTSNVVVFSGGDFRRSLGVDEVRELTALGYVHLQSDLK